MNDGLTHHLVLFLFEAMQTRKSKAFAAVLRRFPILEQAKIALHRKRFNQKIGNGGHIDSG
jgi:hypothetical protein